MTHYVYLKGFALIVACGIARHRVTWTKAKTLVSCKRCKRSLPFRRPEPW